MTAKKIKPTTIKRVREEDLIVPDHSEVNKGPQPVSCAVCPCIVRAGGSVNPCNHPRLRFSLMGTDARLVRMRGDCAWGRAIIK